MVPTTIRPIPAAQTRPLRQRVLRPHQPPEAMVYPGDDAADTLHLGAFVDGALVGIASLYREPPPGEVDPGAWRLRGMAVTPEAQGGGHGRALLEACLVHARRQGGTRVWCNARTTASGFYTRLGFLVQGDVFELPGIGPHHLMSRAP